MDQVECTYIKMPDLIIMQVILVSKDKGDSSVSS